MSRMLTWWFTADASAGILAKRKRLLYQKMLPKAKDYSYIFSTGAIEKELSDLYQYVLHSKCISLGA